jgi:hypothetical protein
MRAARRLFRSRYSTAVKTHIGVTRMRATQTDANQRRTVARAKGLRPSRRLQVGVACRPLRVLSAVPAVGHLAAPRTLCTAAPRA